MKISDFKGLFKKSVVTVESIENPYEDYYSIKFKVEPGTVWEPGEHGIFKLINNKVEGKKWRAFSVASIPSEGVVLIGTRTGKEISSFKKELINMKKGDKVAMTGPFGWFKLQDQSSPLVLFASGVGVTPIRALLKYIEKSSKREVEVVYASNDFYLYGEELEAIAANNPKITLHKTVSIVETSNKLEELAKKYNNGAFYYNSGSPATLKAVKSQLKKLGIKGTRIIDDSFMGY